MDVSGRDDLLVLSMCMHVRGTVGPPLWQGLLGKGRRGQNQPQGGQIRTVPGLILTFTTLDLLDFGN